MSALRKIAVCGAIAIASSGATFGAYVAWAIAHDANAAKRVPFNELLIAGARGDVDEVRYANRVYTFRTKDGKTRVTLGPRANAGDIATLQSPPPRVIVE